MCRVCGDSSRLPLLAGLLPLLGLPKLMASYNFPWGRVKELSSREKLIILGWRKGSFRFP